MTAFANHQFAQTYWTNADCLQQTYERLTWCYGFERARSIVRGEDEVSNADLAAWLRLGDRRPS